MEESRGFWDSHGRREEWRAPRRSPAVTPARGVGAEDVHGCGWREGQLRHEAAKIGVGGAGLRGA